jgi:hypothetical protein
VSATDARTCVACGRDTTDRYFANAGSTRFRDEARDLPPPVPMCRTCKPGPVGETRSIATCSPADVVPVTRSVSGSTPRPSDP